MSDTKNKLFSEVLKEIIDEQEYILINDGDSSYSNVGEAIDEYSEKAIMPPRIERVAIETSYKILESFELYGDFLNPIPCKEKKKIIFTQILPWINRYSSRHLRGLIETKAPIENAGDKEIRKNIGAIEKFELMLLDKFSLLPTEDKYLNVTIGLSSDNYEKDILQSIQNLLKATEDLKNDLKNKSFKIFPKHKYYYPKQATKQELTNILNKIITKYNLKSHSPHKKQLVDSI